MFVSSVVLASVWGDIWHFMTEATAKLDEFSGNWWFLAIVFAIALLDSVIPIVPSEATVIAGGVAAGAGNQQLAFVILAGALGAFAGDNIAYTLGDWMGDWIEGHARKRQGFADKLEWAKKQIRRRGGSLLVTARFIPGGRTALTLSCGITEQPRRWFMGWIAVAATIWATYAASLGYFFGSQFEDNHTMAFIIAFGTAISITLFIEVIRHYWGSDDHAEDTGAHGQASDEDASDDDAGNDGADGNGATSKPVAAGADADGEVETST